MLFVLLVDEDEFFAFYFMREEDLVIFIELGEENKASFIGHKLNGQYRNYFEL